MCDASCSNLKQLAIVVTEMGEQKLKIMNLKIENQKLKERLHLFEKGLVHTSSEANVTPDTSDNESAEPSISTPRRTKRVRSHSDENHHTPARKKSLNQNDNFGDKPFKCSIDKKCLSTFSTKKEALEHARVKHGYGYGCKICSKAFKTESKLNTHKSGDS